MINIEEQIYDRARICERRGHADGSSSPLRAAVWSGSIAVAGQRSSLPKRRAAVHGAIAYVHEDRKSEGLIQILALQITNTVAALDGNPNIEVDRHPLVRAAAAQLNQARLSLSYATVVAPDDGIVGWVDDLQVGDFVNPGEAVFSMMSTRDIWIDANFRETALATGALHGFRQDSKIPWICRITSY
jgi:multidrug efflux pump subunit AcrA (membrane-fusion protein)